MTGILYTKYKGAIALRPTINGKQVAFFTPIWVMEDVIEGTRSFGHFNPKLDMKKGMQKHMKDG